MGYFPEIEAILNAEFAKCVNRGYEQIGAELERDPIHRECYNVTAPDGTVYEVTVDSCRADVADAVEIEVFIGGGRLKTAGRSGGPISLTKRDLLFPE